MEVGRLVKQVFGAGLAGQTMAPCWSARPSPGTLTRCRGSSGGRGRVHVLLQVLAKELKYQVKLLLCEIHGPAAFHRRYQSARVSESGWDRPTAPSPARLT